MSSLLLQMAFPDPVKPLGITTEPVGPLRSINKTAWLGYHTAANHPSRPGPNKMDFSSCTNKEGFHKSSHIYVRMHVPHPIIT